MACRLLPMPDFLRCSSRAITASLILLAGCATSLDAQWTDPQALPMPLQGSTVLVVCEADELVVRNICQDSLATELGALGVRTTMVRPGTGTKADVDPALQGTAAAHLDMARTLGARTVFAVTVLPELRPSRPGVSIGVGLGGWGGGRIGGGIGVSVPVGGAKAATVYGASAVLTPVATGRPAWTARAAGASGDMKAQLERLNQAFIKGAQEASFLPKRP